MESIRRMIFFVATCLHFKCSHSLNCFSCKKIDDPHKCNSSISCQIQQVCYLDVKAGIYKMGCADNQHCGGISNVGIVGRGITSRQSSDCLECCSSDNCNSDLCNHRKHDGQWSGWTTWSNCDVTCDKGIQTKTRTCTNPAPANGGLDCTGNTTETIHCQKDLCPVHGKWSSWSSWGSCSVSCDVGMQRRDRSCSNPYPGRNGDHCFGESRDDRLCFPGACADGAWSSWRSWGSCESGIQSRLRTCSNPRPSLLGRYCDGSPEKSITCNTNQYTVNGVAGVHGVLVQFLAALECSVETGLVQILIQVQMETIASENLATTGCVFLMHAEFNVAFTAYNIYAKLSSSSTILFRSTYINNGNAYNTTTGKFTCKIPGVYYFSVILTKQYKKISNVSAHLRINDAYKLVTYWKPYGDDKNEYESTPLTLTGAFHLNKNDVVYISGISNNFYDSGYSTFTGYLITPD